MLRFPSWPNRKLAVCRASLVWHQTQEKIGSRSRDEMKWKGLSRPLNFLLIRWSLQNCKNYFADDRKKAKILELDQTWAQRPDPTSGHSKLSKSSPEPEPTTIKILNLAPPLQDLISWVTFWFNRNHKKFLWELKALKNRIIPRLQNTYKLQSYKVPFR